MPFANRSLGDGEWAVASRRCEASGVKGSLTALAAPAGRRLTTCLVNMVRRGMRIAFKVAVNGGATHMTLGVTPAGYIRFFSCLRAPAGTFNMFGCVMVSSANGDVVPRLRDASGDRDVHQDPHDPRFQVLYVLVHHFAQLFSLNHD